MRVGIIGGSIAGCATAAQRYRGASAVEPIEAGPHGTTTHLRPGAGTPLFTGGAPHTLVQQA
jgi:glycine/D-amino acid oxidase-like deaminating enzyme